MPTLPDKNVATTIKGTTRPGASTKTTGPLFPPAKTSGTTQTVTPQNRHIRPLLLAGPAGAPVAVVRTIGFQSLTGKTGPVVLNETDHTVPVRPVGPGTVKKTGFQSLIGKTGSVALMRTKGPSVFNKTPPDTTLARPVGSGSAVRTTESPGPTGIRTNLQGKVVIPTTNGATCVLQHQGLQVTPGQNITIVVVNTKK